MSDDFIDNGRPDSESMTSEPAETLVSEPDVTDEPAADHLDTPAAPRADAPQNGTRLVSAKKLEANRANAQKSTGPRTEEGKHVSSRNSLKHGLTARLHNVITRGDVKEDPFEFIELVQSLKEELKPVGLLEELAVEDMAWCYWRKWRAGRWEVGTIERRTVGLREKEGRRRQDKVQNQLSLGRGVVWMLEQHAAGVQHIIDVMQAVKADPARIEPSKDLTWLVQEYPVDFEPDDSQEVQDDSLKVQVDGTETFRWTEEYARRVNEAIDRHVHRLSVLRNKLLRLEETKLDARIRAAAMLNPNEALTIGRYETANDRQLDRAFKRLDLLQRRRRFGESKLKQW